MDILAQEIGQKKLGLNVEVLKESCSKLNDITKKIEPRFRNDVGIDHLSESAHYWRVYNTFLFPYPGFHELFSSIKRIFFEEMGSTNKKYYIQSWLNWYTEGDSIGWHTHSQSSMCEFMTGYYCVDTEPSVTTYKFFNGDEYVIHDLKSRDDYVFYTKLNKPCVEQQHRTWPWNNPDRPRITIAFEIMHEEGIEKHFGLESMYNHWIPL